MVCKDADISPGSQIVVKPVPKMWGGVSIITPAHLDWKKRTFERFGSIKIGSAAMHLLLLLIHQIIKLFRWYDALFYPLNDIVHFLLTSPNPQIAKYDKKYPYPTTIKKQIIFIARFLVVTFFGIEFFKLVTIIIFDSKL